MSQRARDLIVVLLAAPIALAITAAASLAIVLTQGRPILFRQDRVGVGGAPFVLHKLRTMTVPKEGEEPVVTAVGRLLRRSKVDEFPQLWNIARGQMSVVGPRPELDSWTRLYSNKQRRVLSVRPGLTDFASIVLRNEEQLIWRICTGSQLAKDAVYSELILPLKVDLQLAYLEEQSTQTDLRIMVNTLLSLVAPDRALRRVLATLDDRTAEREHLVNEVRRLLLGKAT